MSRRWPVLVGITAVSVLAVALYLRQPSDSAPSREGSVNLDGSSDQAPGARVSAPATPELPRAGTGSPPPPPSLPPVAPSKTAAEVFAEEARDAAWATTTEAALAERLKLVRGAKVQGAECRQTQCQITIAGTMAEVKKGIEDVVSHRGVRGMSKNVILGVPEKKPDGSLTLRAYAVFAR